MDAPQPGPVEWHSVRRCAFRFALCYFVLYLFPFPLDGLPGLGWVAAEWADLWHRIVPWVGANVLRLGKPITVFTNGSGDTTYDYLRVACGLFSSAVLAAIWSAVDFRRPSYPGLHAWLRVYVRYALAMVMIGYGLAKVFKSQFPAPDIDRLLQPIGQASPMGLLWTFMGYSTVYTVFAGASEVVGGLLLFARRTVTLGALICAGVMANIVVLNFSYDVPVKLFSSHLLAMSLYLLLPDAGRLVRVLVLNRGVAPAALGRVFQHRGLFVAAQVAKVAFIGFSVIPAVLGAMQVWSRWGDAAPRPALYGLYEVERFALDGRELAPVTTDPLRWRRVVVTRYGRLAAQKMDDSLERFQMADDATSRTLTLTPRLDPAHAVRLAYDRDAGGKLELRGALHGMQLAARLRPVPAGDSVLMSRGFHWINEYPYNR